MFVVIYVSEQPMVLYFFGKCVYLKPKYTEPWNMQVRTQKAFVSYINNVD